MPLARTEYAAFDQLAASTTLSAGDNVLPVLTSAIDGDPTSDGTDNFGATTSKAGGRFYHAVTANAGSLTKAEVVAATQSGASAILASGSMAVGAAGALVNTTAITGLSPSTDYELFYVHVDANGNMSAVATVGLTTTA